MATGDTGENMTDTDAAYVLEIREHMEKLEAENARLSAELVRLRTRTPSRPERKIFDWLLQAQEIPDGAPLSLDLQRMARPADPTLGNLRWLRDEYSDACVDSAVLMEERDAALAELEQLRASRRWIPVGERLPDLPIDEPFIREWFERRTDAGAIKMLPEYAQVTLPFGRLMFHVYPDSRGLTVWLNGAIIHPRAMTMTRHRFLALAYSLGWKPLPQPPETTPQ